ncbi:MAG: hypothetical protein ACI82A_001835 [Candidatus Azotimanducaceae bacterium]|jgi:hypothetical protein
MKYLAWGMGVLLLIVVAFIAAERLASERIEVIELEAMDESGELVTTRLWIADHDGKQYLRVGADGSGWFSRIQANPAVKVTRGGETMSVIAIPDPSKSEIINQIMQEKYSWGDTLIGKMVGERTGSIPIELRPASSE